MLSKCSLLPPSESEVATPPLTGTILPGVTRKSLLELGKKWVRTFAHMFAQVKIHIICKYVYVCVGVFASYSNEHYTNFIGDEVHCTQ